MQNNPLLFTDPSGLNPAAGVLIGGAIAGPPGALIAGVIGFGIGLYISWDNNLFARPGNESRPRNAPPGTLPIDQIGLGTGDIHDIKDGVLAGGKDWTGIAPNGDVITSDPSGDSINHGPADTFTNRPTGLCK